jgi:hypothetical protein
MLTYLVLSQFFFQKINYTLLLSLALPFTCRPR